MRLLTPDCKAQNAFFFQTHCPVNPKSQQCYVHGRGPEEHGQSPPQETTFTDKRPFSAEKHPDVR